jgi:AraC-like DNA-binding protein
MPSEVAPVIINFAAPTRIVDPRDARRTETLGSFAAGAYDGYVLIGASAPSGGVQIDFTLLGARLFLGRPLRDLANRCVSLDDLIGADARRLAARLFEAPSWDERFTLLDAEIAARVHRARPPSQAVQFAWAHLIRSAGQVSIKTIVDDVGCSPRHLVHQFRDEIGLSPKVIGRVLRFGRAIRLIRSGRHARLADVASVCGYFDQAHFVRDAREFAGATPTALVHSLLPGTGGFQVESGEIGEP